MNSVVWDFFCKKKAWNTCKKKKKEKKRKEEKGKKIEVYFSIFFLAEWTKRIVKIQAMIRVMF